MRKNSFNEVKEIFIMETMNKTFYTEKESHNGESFEMENEIRPAIKDLIIKWSEKGYKIREIQSILKTLVDQISLSIICRKRKT